MLLSLNCNYLFIRFFLLWEWTVFVASNLMNSIVIYCLRFWILISTNELSRSLSRNSNYSMELWNLKKTYRIFFPCQKSCTWRTCKQCAANCIFYWRTSIPTTSWKGKKPKYFICLAFVQYRFQFFLLSWKAYDEIVRRKSSIVRISVKLFREMLIDAKRVCSKNVDTFFVYQ